MNLSETLKSYRKKKGLRQKEIANLLGISREHYAMIEEGRKPPSYKLIKKISKELKITFIFVILPDGSEALDLLKKYSAD